MFSLPPGLPLCCVNSISCFTHCFVTYLRYNFIRITSKTGRKSKSLFQPSHLYVLPFVWCSTLHHIPVHCAELCINFNNKLWYSIYTTILILVSVRLSILYDIPSRFNKQRFNTLIVPKALLSCCWATLFNKRSKKLSCINAPMMYLHSGYFEVKDLSNL